jgi:small-conductance mechanosensitive channel
MGARLYRFVAGPELGLVGTLLFIGLYTWPFLTLSRPSATFQFFFITWVLHVAFLAATSFAHRKLAALEQALGSQSDSRPAQ